MIRTIHRAKYVLAEADHLLPDAAVHVSERGRISRVEPWQSPPAGPETDVCDWGSAVVLPGLINTHTHLELTRLHGQVTQFSCFVDWISQLIQKRRDWSRDDYLASTRQGAEMSLSSGTTLVGDISTSGFSWEALKQVKLRKVVFEEALSFLPENAPATLEALRTRIGRIRPDNLLKIGVSPHAPYSVSADLYRGIVALARERALPLATHLAETKEEVEFLRTGMGGIRTLLQSLKTLPEGWSAPRVDPVAYVEKLEVLEHPSLLIHCNYLDNDAKSRIRNSHSSVVYCPRSHAFFRHEAHPVRELLDLGVNVALGTDSLASNNSLSVLDEMRFLFKNRKDLKAEEIFRMATLNGAAALGYGSALGRLRRGYLADMTILKLPEDLGAKRFLREILEGAGECEATIVAGRLAWKRE